MTPHIDLTMIGGNLLNKKKDEDKKTENIILRVTKKEKARLQNKAKHSGLSLSAYVLRSAMNKQIVAQPSQKIREAMSYFMTKEAYDFFNGNSNSAEERVRFVRKILTDLYFERKTMETECYGNDKNMGD